MSHIPFAVGTALVALCALTAQSAECLFVGKAGGIWDEPSSWASGKVPGAKDEVTLRECTAVAPKGVKVRALRLEGARLTVGDGKGRISIEVAQDLVLDKSSRLRVKAGGFEDAAAVMDAAKRDAALWAAANPVLVGRRLAVLGGSVVEPEAHPLYGTPVVFRVRDLELDEDAWFYATGLGWSWSGAAFATAPKGAQQRIREGHPTADFWTIAPGSGRNYNVGGNYKYGSPFAPFLPGSPSGNYYATAGNPDLGRGPGSIVLIVKGAARIEGTLCADASNPKDPKQGDGGRPSGGGIWLALSSKFTFGPRVRLTACGGSPTSGNQFGPGAGGRIALALGLSEAELTTLATTGKADGLETFDSLQGLSGSVLGGHKPANPKDPGQVGTLRVVRGKASLASVAVRGNPVSTVGMKPASGMASYSRRSSQRFTAPSCGVDVGNEGIRYTCLGYVVSNATACVASGKGTSATVKIGDEPLTVTWLWGKPEYRVRVLKPDSASVVFGGKKYAGDFIRWTSGAVPAVSVLPDDHYVFLGWKKPLPAQVTEPLDLEPNLIHGAVARDATLVALPTNNVCVYPAPIGVAGRPTALGVEIEGAPAGVQIGLVLVDKNKVQYKTAFAAGGPFTLCPLDRTHWRTSDAKAKEIVFPVALSAVALKGGAAKVKSVRAAYPKPLGRAARHFADNLSRGQRLGGTVTTEKETVVTLPNAPRSGIRFALNGVKGARLEIVWSTGYVEKCPINVRDQTENLLENVFGLKKGTPFTVHDSIVDLGSQRRQFVRPYFRPYRSSSAMVPMGFDYLADAEALPGASTHINDFTFLRSNKYCSLIWDGSRGWGFGPLKEQAAKAELKEIRFVFPAGVEYALKTDDTQGIDLDRYEMLDLAANPRAKAFVRAKFAEGTKPGLVKVGGAPVRLVAPIDSADVAICHQGKGSWALEVDEYTGRKPGDGFGAAVHYRVPARDYVRAHVVFALDDDPKKDKVLNLRLAHYILNGSGSNMIGDSQVDLRKGIPAGVTKMGSVVRQGKRYELYGMTVRLDPSNCIAEAARGGYIDFELMGVKAGSKPDAKRESAFNIFGVTLEAAPATLDVVSAPHAPYNVFTRDEAEKYLKLTLRSERADAKCALSWVAKDWNGKTLLKDSVEVGPLARGKKFEQRIDLPKDAEPGLYLMDIKVEGDGGATTYSHKTRFAVLPPAGRKVATEASPYATWWFFGSHGSPNNWDMGGPILQKAGIRKSSHHNWSTNVIQKYGVTFTGNVAAPSQRRFFDPKTGHFKPQNGVDGETFFVNEIKRQIASVPYVDHILVWHENCPRGEIPEEILDLPVPAATDEDRAAGAYVNEVGRLVRKHFPKLKIQIGNSSASLGASYRPFRGGADPQYYDAVGIETPSQTMMPERLLVWGLQGMMMTKEAASYYAKRPVPAFGCFEYVYRTERAIGEELQAAWYMRDVLISLANRMPMISPAVTFDVRNAYYDTLWGRAGMFFRAPYCEPKLSYVAYAALTKALDGVTYIRELDTGSTTVYAILFKRCDGQYATAVWCARGEAELKIEGGGKGLVMDGCGKESQLGGLFSGRVAKASEMPSYVITEKPVEGVTIKSRTFSQAETAAKRAKTIYRFADASEVKVSPDMRIKSRGHGCLPMMRPSQHFGVRAVKDDDRGACLEVSLDTKAEKVNRYFTEYSTLRLAKPAEIPLDSAAIGVWVKGNSSWGQVRFEIEDADGDVYVNYAHPVLWDTLDWAGLLCVNFDSWAYVSCWLPGGPGLAYDRETGLRNAPWSREGSRPGSNGRLDLPAKLKAVTVGINRMKLDILDFKPTDTKVLLGEVGVEAAKAKSGPRAETVKIVIDGAEAD